MKQEVWCVVNWSIHPSLLTRWLCVLWVCVCVRLRLTWNARWFDKPKPSGKSSVETVRKFAGTFKKYLAGDRTNHLPNTLYQLRQLVNQTHWKEKRTKSPHFLSKMFTKMKINRCVHISEVLLLTKFSKKFCIPPPPPHERERIQLLFELW